MQDPSESAQGTTMAVRTSYLNLVREGGVRHGDISTFLCLQHWSSAQLSRGDSHVRNLLHVCRYHQ
jgi:hypothetical protein